MTAGANGLGKATFINTLVSSQLVPERQLPAADQVHQELPMSFTSHQVELEEDGVRISLTVVDTHNLDGCMNVSGAISECRKYIEQCYDEQLQEETRIKRNPKFQDNRVHLLLYFVEPTGHALGERDLEFMKVMAPLVNIVPVVGKADSLCPVELIQFRQRVMEDFQHHKIPIYDFPWDEEHDDAETIEDSKALRAMLPFRVIGAEGVYTVEGNKKARGRQYPWGVAQVDNDEHCDFSALRYAIFTTHMAEFKESTDEYLYETWRTKRLSELDAVPGGAEPITSAGAEEGSLLDLKRRQFVVPHQQ